MYPCGDDNITAWRRERTHGRRERARNSDNRDSSVATGYWSNGDGFGIAWLRDPKIRYGLKGQVIYIRKLHNFDRPDRATYSFTLYLDRKLYT